MLGRVSVPEHGEIAVVMPLSCWAHVAAQLPVRC
jgi:hypothetical protein